MDEISDFKDFCRKKFPIIFRQKWINPIDEIKIFDTIVPLDSSMFNENIKEKTYYHWN